MARTKTRLTAGRARRTAKAVKQQRTAKEAQQLSGHNKRHDGFIFWTFSHDSRTPMQRLNDGEPVTAEMLQALFRDQAEEIKVLREDLARATARIAELEMPRSRKARRWLAGKLAPKAQPATQCAGASIGLRYIDDE